MGIENERNAALSTESIPKSLSEVQTMEVTTEGAVAGEILEPPELQKQPKSIEKNGEIDKTRSRATQQCFILINCFVYSFHSEMRNECKVAPSGALFIFFNFFMTRLGGLSTRKYSYKAVAT